MPRWRTTRLLLLLVGLAMAGLSACQRQGPSELRVTVIGVDGADWKVVDPLLAQGKLPNLARLIRDGVRAPLRSTYPLISPPVWTTIATGVPRAEHGISGFEIAHSDAEARMGGSLVSSRDRKVPALWTLASRESLRTAVLGWWATYPAEKIDGVMVSERASKIRESDLDTVLKGVTTVSDQALAYPPEAYETVVDLMAGGPQRAIGEPLETMVAAMRHEDRAVVRSLDAVRSAFGRFRLEMILMRGVDVISHYAWKFHEPDADVYTDGVRPSQEEVERYGETVRDHYVFVDGLIGELLSDDLQRHAVMIVSDHGFEAVAPKVGAEKAREVSGSHLRKAALHGVFIGSGGPFRKGMTLEEASIFDIAPTVAYLLGLPVSKSLQSEPLLAVLEPSWTSGRPVDFVDSYPAPPVMLPDDAGRESPLDDAMREQLRNLGYIE